MGKRIVALTTDFGLKDPFVGIMRGVILGINPDATIVDLCHEVEPGNILRASYLLDSAVSFFPENTIHVVVVDPGVGSDRKGILVSSGVSCFVAPDNGVLTLPLKNRAPGCVIELENSDYFRQPVSATFHGRDIFAPVAAHLSLGRDIRSFGTELDSLVRLDIAEPEILGNNDVKGEIIYADRFGNMATNLTLPQEMETGLWEMQTNAFASIPLLTHYNAAKPGELSALINSSGVIELFVKNGNAGETFGLKEKDEVFLVRKIL